MKKNKPVKILAITTGDQDGIGPEVAYKALAATAPKPGFSFIVFRGPKISRSLLKAVEKTRNRTEVASLDEALSETPSPKTLIEIVSDDLPPHWVEQSAAAAVQKNVTAIVSAPLSKTLIHSAGLKELGHTEILRRVSQSPPVTMSFWGPRFSVALGSTHIPVKDIPRKITLENLEHHLRNVIWFFPKPKRGPFRIGIVGLNPHAGEEGLIGEEETAVFEPVLKKLRAEFPKVKLSAPLVPDAAFQAQNQKNHDVFFCTYHDQGLIPFKLAHGQSRGCQISLGLPFVRTSVDHGTAKDLFGKNKANPGSMLDAIKTAIVLLS